MASVTKSRHGTWQVRWRTLDGKGRKKNFPRKVDADVFAVEVEAARNRGLSIDPRLGKTRFGEWLQRWSEGRLGLAPSTRNRDASLIRNHVESAFGSQTIASITPDQIRQWVSRLARDLAPVTVHKAYQLLAACLDAAVEDGLIGRTPARGVNLPTQRQTEKRFLSAEEVEQLADAIDGRYRAMVLTAAWTGLRFGELAALRVSDLALLSKRLSVTRALKRDGGRISFGPPKSRASRRTVALPASLVDVLADHLRRYPSEELVFTSPEGGVVRATNFRRRTWQPAVREAGLEPLRFHDLRHTHAALLIAEGVHAKVIQSRLGHASIRTTLDVYGHLFEGMDEAAAEALDGAISRAAVPLSRPLGQIESIADHA